MLVQLVKHRDVLIRPADVILAIPEIGVFERGDRKDQEGSNFAGHNVP